MDSIANILLRPRRIRYSTLQLGPKSFLVDNKKFQRKDLHIRNTRGLKLKCSYFKAPNSKGCVVYCHGNSGNRLEALSVLAVALKSSLDVFCFDFSGAGLSEGEKVSLGYFEQEDVRCVVAYLRWSGERRLGLWGRSMGAVAALLYASSDESVSFVVADSPFASLELLCSDVMHKHIRLPSLLARFFIGRFRKKVMQLGGFDLR